MNRTAYKEAASQYRYLTNFGAIAADRMSDGEQVNEREQDAGEWFDFCRSYASTARHFTRPLGFDTAQVSL